MWPLVICVLNLRHVPARVDGSEIIALPEQCDILHINWLARSFSSELGVSVSGKCDAVICPHPFKTIDPSVCLLPSASSQPSSKDVGVPSNLRNVKVLVSEAFDIISLHNSLSSVLSIQKKTMRNKGAVEIHC